MKAFRSSPDAMVITRLRDGQIIDTNQRCEAIFGYSRGEATGRTVFDLNIYTSDADREKLVAGVAAGILPHDLELLLRTKQGEVRHTQISAQPDDIAGEQCLIVVIRDITDRKRAEEAQQNLTHASRLAVVGELTAMIAHEVNQPLGAILSNADAGEMLLESAAPPLNEIREILAAIKKNDLRASEAIKRIRTLLRKQEMEMQPLDLNETIVDVLRLVTGDALRRSVKIRTELGPGLPLVRGDRVHLQQVLLNLVVNGMDAMDAIPESERRIIVKTEPDNPSCVRVSVTDSGPGIPPERLPRVFESFFTTKKEGMGLGLSIARSIIRAHQGQIWVENKPNGGVSFYFELPVDTSAIRITGDGYSAVHPRAVKHPLNADEQPNLEMRADALT